MQPNPWNTDEPLIEGHAALPPGAFDLPAPSAEFTDALRTRTIAAVRRRARFRRAIALGGALTAYAAGLATAFLVARPAAEPSAQDRLAAVSAPAAPRPDDSPAPASPAAAPAPWDLEQQAARAPEPERLRLLKLAGNTYLADYLDIESALRCYRHLLDLSPPAQQTTPEPDDSWLLVSLRQARRQEKPHERSES